MGHWSASSPFSCEPITQGPIQAEKNTQLIALPGIILRDERPVGLYIDLHPKSAMVLGAEGIWTME